MPEPLTCPHCSAPLTEAAVLRLYGKAMSARRKTRCTGNPANLKPCRYCGRPLGTRARRKHEPGCESRTALKYTREAVERVLRKLPQIDVKPMTAAGQKPD